MTPKSQLIAVSATFSLELLKEPLESWLEKLRLQAALEFCPFNQLFQSLASPSSPFRSDATLANLALLRIEDLTDLSSWDGTDASNLTADREHSRKELARSKATLVSLIRSVVEARPVPIVVCICPASRKTERDPGLKTLLAKAGAEFLEDLRRISGVMAFDSSGLASAPGMGEIHDPTSDSLASIPYSAEFYNALAAGLMRKLHSRYQPERKVVVVDCDGTLWSGVCAEDGAEGITVDQHRLELHKFLLRQRDMGRLLAICSRNEPSDVFNVFDTREDLILKREHFSSYRINWQTKSENLSQIASELNLGLGSFVFIDDDPVQCAEVREKLPEVVTLALPGDPALIPGFIENIWVLDSPVFQTREDQNRVRFHQQQLEREELRVKAPTLEEFLESLELKIEISPLTEAEFDRVSQLTYRTTQFNTTGKRIQPQELKEFLKQTGCSGRVVHVSDRLGNYGLVGVLLLRSGVESLVVEGFLLSCRALGRGVENQMAVHLGQTAMASGTSVIEFPFNPTSRNRPALIFLESTLRATKAAGTTTSERYSVSVASALQAASPRQSGDTSAHSTSMAASLSSATIPTGSRMGDRWQIDSVTAQQIAEGLGSWKTFNRSRSNGAEAKAAQRELQSDRTSSDIETAIAKIWQDLMQVDSVGRDDNFFELGGHSITVIQTISRIRAQLGIEIPIRTIFDTPTIAELARFIESRKEASATASAGVLVTEEIRTHQAAIRPSVSSGIETVLAAGPAISGQPSRLSTLAIPTRNRPEALLRGVPSWANHFHEHGHEHLSFLVVDDSDDLECRSKNFKILGQLQKSQNFQFRYTDLPAREAYAGSLARAAEVPTELVKFGLVDSSGAGRVRNCILLESAGEMVMTADDDILCRPAAAPGASGQIRIGNLECPESHWFFADPSAAIESCGDSNLDCISQLESFLGRDAIELLSSQGADGSLKSGRILLATPGIAGDPGWNIPFGWWGGPLGYLMLPAESHKRLVGNPETYRAACSNRAMIRCARNPALGKFATHLAGVAGMDNREPCLPPFPPFSPGEDVLFSRMMRACRPEDWGVHLPWMIPHAPFARRSFQHSELFRSASSHDWTRLLLDCIDALPETGEGLDEEKRMRRIGEFLVELGSLPESEFIEFACQQALQSRSRWIEEMRIRLEKENHTPAFWAKDLQRYVDICEQYLTDPLFGIPLDLITNSASPSSAWNQARQHLRNYGHLVCAWPQLTKTARLLAAKGIRMTRHIPNG